MRKRFDAAEAGDGYSVARGVTVSEFLQVVIRYKLVILGSAVLAGLVFGAVALLMTPVFRADVVLAAVSDLEDNNRYMTQLGELGGLAALAGVKLDSKDRKSESIATLQSRRFTDQFIRDRKLERILFADLWNREQQRWQTADKDDIPTAWDAFKRFDEDVRHVRIDRTTGLITVSVDWKDPALAAQWANELVSDVNANLRQRTIEESQRAIEYLQQQLAQTSVVELQQALHQLIESEMKKILLAKVNEEYAFKVIDPAVVPQEPARPKPVLMVALGVLLGLALGIVAAFALNARRNSGSGLRVDRSTR